MVKLGGSRNHFYGKHADDLRQLILTHYGSAWPEIIKMRHEHVKRKGGCHVCAEALENRFFGKVPVTVTHTGKNLQPIILVSVNDRPKIGVEIPELAEGSEEGEYEEVDEGEETTP